MSVSVSCQRCRQPLIPSTLPLPLNAPPFSSWSLSSSSRGQGRLLPDQQQQQKQQQLAYGHAAHVQDSVAALSPSAYDFLSASDRFSPGGPAPVVAPPRDTLPPASRDPDPVATKRFLRSYPQMYGIATRAGATARRTPGDAAGGGTRVDRLVVPPASLATAAKDTIAQPQPSQERQQPSAPGRKNPLLGPQDSFVVLSDSVFQPPPASGGIISGSRPLQQPPQSQSIGTAGHAPSQQGQPTRPDDPNGGAAAHSASTDGADSLQSHLAQLSALYTLLSTSPTAGGPSSRTGSSGGGSGGGGTGLAHPLCTECTELLFELMTRELDALKKERDRLVGFEKEVTRKRDEAAKARAAAAAGQGDEAGGGAGAGASGEQLKESLERDIAKLRKAEAHAIAELKAVEAQKGTLAADKEALDAEEAELAAEEAEFWRDHSKYLLRRDELQDREGALETRLANGKRELEKLQKTNVYNDAFCIGQEAGFGTINGLRLGRLPGVNVEWPEINAAWGHTLLLLSTVARKFGFRHFRGYRLVPCGSFSTIEKLDEGAGAGGAGAGGGTVGGGHAQREAEGQREWEAYGRSEGGSAGQLDYGREDNAAVVAVYELYGSGDFAVTRLLQNRRFDMAMVAFLECLRRLVEFVTARDPKIRVPHAVVKDRIGDVSIKLQFGSDEAWTRALRHVLLDLKILLSRASL
ncbi:hypothetical protein JCM8202_004283 [Rhodotorula sphaerocarpa]